MKNYFVIAHRGESFLAPENTLSSINLAWANGSDAVEIDIRLTKDNRIVVIHDANTIRVSGRFKWVRKSMLKDLKKLDVGRFKDKKYEEEKIPELTEVLNTVPANKKIIIEIKCGKEIVPLLMNDLLNAGLQPNQIEIISFKLNVLKEIRKKLPQYHAYWIVAISNYKIFRFFQSSIHKIIEQTMKNKLNGLNLNDGIHLTQRNISRIKSVNLRLYVWTVNDIKRIKELINFGVDGITTDKAGFVISELN
ncbi:MAG: glycerophosphodiester phosphodiesterase family protein [Bacteroidales bacterium]